MTESYIVASTEDMKDDFFDLDACDQFRTREEAEDYIKKMDLNKDKSGDDIVKVWAYEDNRKDVSTAVAKLLEGTSIRDIVMEASSEKYLGIDAIKTNGKVSSFFADPSLITDFYNFMNTWNKANESYYKSHYSGLEYKPLRFSIGRNYIKVVGKGFVECFIDKFGNVYKAASWQAPAKGVRFYLDMYDSINFDPHTGFLYGNRNLPPRDESFYNKEEDAVNEGVDKSVEDALKEIETDDYQNRDGDYPMSGVPDTIHVYGKSVECEFKNTPEEIAEQWLEKYLRQNGFTFEKVGSCQDGDYDNDWVRAWATVTGFTK